ncbi:MAG: tetratricopeptide repeat-containing sensor histidine kinase, partial [Cyclobacteriaceae bacterium]
HKGNYTAALEHFQKFVTNFKDQKAAASGWFQIGAVQTALGNFDQSLAAHEYALRIHEKSKNWNAVVHALNGIGIIYTKMGKYNKAIQTYNKAIAVNDSLNLGKDLTYIRGNIGNAYYNLKEYEKALEAYQQSFNIATEFDNQHGIASSLSRIGSVYSAMKQYNQALSFHLKALNIRQKLPQKRDIALSLLEVGTSYTELKQHSLAEENLLQGLNLTQELGIKEYERDAFQYLSELYASIKDYDKAYEIREKYHALNDSIFSEEKVKQINELQTKYETAEKDKQITLLAKEKEIQAKEAQRQATLKKASIGVSGLIALVAGLFLYMFRQRLKNQKALAAKSDEIKKAHFKQQLGELEMKALRSQMNPHFIFNCMNSINRMILSGDIDGSSMYLTKFAKLIRLMLENSEKPTVPLEKELAMLESYIQLESLSNKGKIKYEISVDPEVDLEAIHIPSMVLQPFIENAIWHGLMNKKEEDGQIKIVIKEDGDLLKCVIEDNGIGREKALELKKQAVLKSKSMGLSITQKRLQLLSKEALREMVHFTDLKDHSDQPLGTRVDVLIPIS